MRELNFERTVWAERQLAKMCPNNDIKKLGEVVTTDDFDKQIDAIESMIIIMNEASERKAHFLDNTHEMNVITREELENLVPCEFYADLLTWLSRYTGCIAVWNRCIAGEPNLHQKAVLRKLKLAGLYHGGVS